MTGHILDAFLALRAVRPTLLPQRRIRVRCEDDLELLVGVFEPEPQRAQDVLLFFHGAGAHMAAGYLDLGAELHQASRCAVLVPDLRGHGRSGGARGELDAAPTLWRDVDALVCCAMQRYPRARVHVGGHSLGAGLALNWSSHSSEAAALARHGRLQSLLLVAPYTGLAQADRVCPPGVAPFIHRPSAKNGDVQFDYSADLAARGGLVRSIQSAMFDALAPADFLGQLRQVLQERKLPTSILLLRDDELFDAGVLQGLLSPLVAPAAGRLRVDCIPGAHLGGLFTVAPAVCKALAAASRPPVSTQTEGPVLHAPAENPGGTLHMSRVELPASLISSASSLLPQGVLPDGDRRAWSHSVADLALGFMRDGCSSRIAEADGRSLQPGDVEHALDRLRAAGVGAGGVVIVQVYNDVTAVASLLATWLNACCVCPVDPDTPAEVLAMIAREACAKAMVHADGRIELLPREHGAPSLQRNLIRLRRPPRVTGADLALVIFTSGSSGQPKGVMLSHQNVMSALRSLGAYLGLREGDRILSIPPLFFDYGLYQLLLTLFEGCSLVLNGRQTSVVMLLRQVEQHSPTVLPVVPALASGLARMFTTVHKTAPSVRLVTNTGGHLSDHTIEELEQAFPNTRVMPMYGLTESKRALFLDRERYPGRSGCVGVAMPGLEALVAVRDGDALRVARPDEVGELHVRGPSVMQGYHRLDASGGARIAPGAYRDDNWLATGDLFSMDADGLAYFRGRSKDLIKQGGYCIYPRDVEAMAEGVAGIVAARVTARQEANGDESAVLFAQVVAALTREQRKDLLARIRERVPRTIMPREVRFVEDWPATPNGKIDAQQLAALAAQPQRAGA